MKQQQQRTGVTIFFSYAEADQALRDQLTIHLSQLKRDRLIEEWSDQQIFPGSDRSQIIDQMIRSANIIILLISADFLASDACYQEQMQQALERHRRGEARVIPIIARPCDWQHSPFAHLQCLPRNARPITSRDNLDTILTTIVEELRIISAQQHFPAPPLSNDQRHHRTRLLKRVDITWIKGLLENSLHQAAWIDLHLQEQTDALENPWRLQVQELKHAPYTLPMGTSIVEVYDEADGELLILGEPGAGKTTQLLQLARTLLGRAEADERLPIPVIFNLSSWTQEKKAFAIWLVEELQTKYQVPHQIGQSWIEGGKVLLLLDGLDEVAEKARIDCVQAICTYCYEHPGQTKASLAICCRSEEYQTLSLHLPLQRAISILPLTEEQVDRYLSSAQGQLEGLRQILRDDKELAKLACRPLILNIFTLAYQGINLTELPIESVQKHTLHTIFKYYVQRMLTRRGQLHSWKQEQFLHWLNHIAKQLHQHSQTVFSAENLIWYLTDEAQRHLYLRAVILVFGLLGILIGGLVGGLSFGLLGILIGGLVGGLSFGLLGCLRIGLLGPPGGSGFLLTGGLVGGLVGGLIGGLVSTLAGGLIGGSVGGLIGITIRMIDRISNLQSIRKLPVGLAYVLIFTLVFGLPIGLVFGSNVGIILGSVCSPISLMTFIFRRSIMEHNQSIRERLFVAFFVPLFLSLFGVPIGLLIGLGFGMAFEPNFGLILKLVGGLVVGLVSMLVFEPSYLFIMSLVCRFLSWRTNSLPWNIIPFLDEASKRLLLRKVGSDYIFIHRLLLDYFASLDEPATENTSPKHEE